MFGRFVVLIATTLTAAGAADNVNIKVVEEIAAKVNGDIITRGESVRGGKESEDDAKPMLPPAAATQRKSLLGSLFGRK